MTFVVSLLLGLAVGVVYALLRVTPPAPPLVALVGLLGMLAGASATDWARSKLAAPRPPAAAVGPASTADSARAGATPSGDPL